jgi:hypothetical protein
MSKYQKDIYEYYARMEDEARLRSGGKQTSYRTYTRQACNFVFPSISQYVSGEQRPRPSRFKLSEQEAEKLATSKLKIDTFSGTITDVRGYMMALKKYIKSLEDYLDEIDRDDIANKHTIMDDVESYHVKYNNNYEEFFKNHKKSRLFEALYTSSPKIINMVFNILKSAGPVLIYSNYVIMEGIEIIKIYLGYFGFTKYGEKNNKKHFVYAEYHGGITDDDRIKNKDAFNLKENSHGEIIKIIMFSPAGVEGISLMSVRQIHILEPYWHEVRIVQMIGRGIRMCSHKYLPMKERHVDIYRYKSVLDDNKITTDQYIEESAKNKDRLITSFLDAMKEASVDCELNYAHNVLNGDIKCFKFDEPTLYGKQIGPAYKKDVLDDINMNNGSNSLQSLTRKIKVIKIQAVKKLDDKSEKYTKPEKYWYHQDTHNVYDFELHYPIGKVGLDNDGNAMRLDKDTYIIDKVIPIPMIRD